MACKAFDRLEQGSDANGYLRGQQALLQEAVLVSAPLEVERAVSAISASLLLYRAGLCP